MKIGRLAGGLTWDESEEVREICCKTLKNEKTQRFCSALSEKLLNKDYMEKRQNLKRLLEIPQVVENDRELEKRKRVNYVSLVEIIPLHE